jgi:hypothetical protein
VQQDQRAETDREQNLENGEYLCHRRARVPAA